MVSTGQFEVSSFKPEWPRKRGFLPEVGTRTGDRRRCEIQAPPYRLIQLRMVNAALYAQQLNSEEIGNKDTEKWSACVRLRPRIHRRIIFCKWSVVRSQLLVRASIMDVGACAGRSAAVRGEKPSGKGAEGEPSPNESEPKPSHGSPLLAFARDCSALLAFRQKVFFAARRHREAVLWTTPASARRNQGGAIDANRRPALQSMS
jgi:hypothetical protein